MTIYWSLLCILISLLIYISPIPKLVRVALGPNLKYAQWMLYIAIALAFIIGSNGILLFAVVIFTIFIYLINKIRNKTK